MAANMDWNAMAAKTTKIVRDVFAAIVKLN